MCGGSDSCPGPHLPAHPTPAADAPTRQPCQTTAEGWQGSTGLPETGPQAAGRCAGGGKEGKAPRGAQAGPRRAERGGRARGARRLRHPRKWRQPRAGDERGQAEAGRASAPGARPGRGSLTGLGRAAPSPPPRRRRPRPRPPPPRAARSVPAARLGHSAPPLSSARSCSRRRAPAAAAAAARADGGPGAPAAAAALLRSLARAAAAAAAAGPGAAFAFAGSWWISLSQAAPLPAPGPSPALTYALRSRRGRDVGRCRNAPFGLGRAPAAGRTRDTGVRT